MLLNELRGYCPNAMPMHMPGHKRNAGLAPYLEALGAQWDITEIDGFDDLHAPEGILRQAMERAARLWGSEESIFLVCGSTGGLLAAVYALAAQGGKAIVARNCHKSVFHALEITGVKPRFVLPAMDEITGACGRITPESVERALETTPGARFVLLTSPTYEGVISDVGEICRLAHARGVPVIVDEAHGAHLGLYGVFPDGAVRAGADIVIQSLHKTLPALTQSAIAHINGPRVDRRAFWHALDIFETSSPSYLLMASMDGCAALLEERGKELLGAWRRALERFNAGARQLRALRVASGEGRDPGKLVILTGGAGLTGFQLMEMLRREHGIELEMAMPDYALAMTGAGDSEETLNAFLKALKTIDGGLTPRGDGTAPRGVLQPTLPEAVCSPREALYRQRSMMDMERAAGRVSGEYVWAYPPGVPLIVPGERIPDELPAQWRRLKECGAKICTTLGEEGRIGIIAEEGEKSSCR